MRRCVETGDSSLNNLSVKQQGSEPESEQVAHILRGLSVLMPQQDGMILFSQDA